VTISTFGKRRFSRQKARKYTWRIKKNKYIDSELYTQRSGLINVPNLNNNVPGGLFLQNNVFYKRVGHICESATLH
jgi:hypothetical protein